ncbi:retrovirus-related Pol polyprotein from transposon opus [Nephila pilipes]|uniref:RNA-directed DNA polymerase n=1 Tax=Nephila pilipes TaxID=299642 RepID=A0A8X6TXB2_NEPPI|nr:retrovirus-related Pol polyprotein from transposon opus [Nephila pilipes]
MMGLQEVNGTIVKKEVLMVIGVNSRLERKSSIIYFLGNILKKQVSEIKKLTCFICGSDKHFRQNCPKNKGVDDKRSNVNKVSMEGTELEDGTVAARVDLLDKVIHRQTTEDKLSKLVKTSISVDGKLVHALVDSGTEITVVKKDLVPGISVEGASTIYLKSKFFGPAVKCSLVYVPIGLATGLQIFLNILERARSEENLLAQSSQYLGGDSGALGETKVSYGILLEKAPENIEDSQSNITSCRNEVGTTITKYKEVTAETDKGSMVADSFRSEQKCCVELALAWEHAKEGKGNYYEVEGYLFHKDKIIGESIGQLVVPECRWTDVLRLAHTSVFSSHMCPKMTLERIKYSFFWEGLRADVRKFCESCKECQLTRSVRINDRSLITPVARPELPFQVVNLDLVGPIDPPSSKGHKYILCLVDQHTRWGEGWCLAQQDAEGIYRQIAFASQKFNATQKNWVSIEKEAWAVLYGLNKFAKWIYGAKVEIISDHNPFNGKISHKGLTLLLGGAYKNLEPAPSSRYGDLAAGQVYRGGPGNDRRSIF